MKRAELEELIGDLAALMGVPLGCLNQLRHEAPAPRSALGSGNDVAALVRDFLVHTVGLGVDLP